MILLNDSSLDRYFRHASGEIYAISQTLAHFISINRFILLLIHFLSAQKLYSTEHLNVCHPQTCRNKGKESFTLTYLFFHMVDLYCVPMPTMMLLLDPGLLGLILSILMKESFAALGHQVSLWTIIEPFQFFQ